MFRAWIFARINIDLVASEDPLDFVRFDSTIASAIDDRHMLRSRASKLVCYLLRYLFQLAPRRQRSARSRNNLIKLERNVIIERDSAFHFAQLRFATKFPAKNLDKLFDSVYNKKRKKEKQK